MSFLSVFGLFQNVIFQLAAPYLYIHQYNMTFIIIIIDLRNVFRLLSGGMRDD